MRLGGFKNRRWPEVLRRVALHPVSAGVSLELLLAAYFNHRGPAAERALGSQAATLTALIHAQYSGYTLRLAGVVLLLTVALGVALGTGAWLAIQWRQALTGEERSWWRDWRRAVVLVALVHGLWLCWSMSRWPQLYTEAFQEEPGRSFLHLWTDHLRDPGVALLGLPAVLWVLGLPKSLGRDRRARWRRILPGAAVGIALVLFWQASWRIFPKKNATTQGEKRPDIVILAVDSMRWDHVRPEVMPRLAALAQSGLTFTRAYVTVPRTFPSWITMLTGVSPHRHGVRHMFPRWEDRATTPAMLPGELRAAGYRTVVVSDFAGDVFPRMNAGFEVVVAPRFDFHSLMAQRALEAQAHLLPWLHTRAGRRLFPVMRELSQAADPYMLAQDAVDQIEQADARPQLTVVFFSAAHFPYAAPQEEPLSSAYRGRFRYHKPATLEEQERLDAADQEQVRRLYARSLAAIDRASEAVLAAAKRRGRPTVFVVLADHGEHLFERDRGQGHGDHLAGDEVVHVPLVLAGNGVEIPVGHRDNLVRDVDLVSTLANLASLPWPHPTEGVSLLSEPVAPRYAFAETGLWFTTEVAGVPPKERLPYPPMSGLLEVDREHGDELVLRREWQDLTTAAKHRMVRDERHKLLYLPTRSGPQIRLFDTQNDPSEQHDIGEQDRKTRERLLDQLCRWMAEASDAGTRLAREELPCAKP